MSKTELTTGRNGRPSPPAEDHVDEVNEKKPETKYKFVKALAPIDPLSIDEKLIEKAITAAINLRLGNSKE